MAFIYMRLRQVIRRNLSDYARLEEFASVSVHAEAEGSVTVGKISLVLECFLTIVESFFLRFTPADVFLLYAIHCMLCTFTCFGVYRLEEVGERMDEFFERLNCAAHPLQLTDELLKFCACIWGIHVLDSIDASRVETDTFFRYETPAQSDAIFE